METTYTPHPGAGVHDGKTASFEVATGAMASPSKRLLKFPVPRSRNMTDCLPSGQVRVNTTPFSSGVGQGSPSIPAGTVRCSKEPPVTVAAAITLLPPSTPDEK